MKIALLIIMGLLMAVTFPMAVPDLWLKREGLLGILILALALTVLVLVLWF